MKYAFVYTRRAEKDIKKLDPAIKKQIGHAVQKLKKNPIERSEKLSDPKKWRGSYLYN